MQHFFLNKYPSWTPAAKRVIAALAVATLAACGGSSGSPDPTIPAPPPVAPTPVACAPFTDSFGASVSCEEMKLLAGANLAFVEGGGGSEASSGAGEAGADGTGADGEAIANMELEFVDINGNKVTTRTNANGYFRISLRGMKAPLVATVKRSGNPWKSMLVADIVRAPANRAFYTINLTGLTDVVASDLAKKAGLSNADALTPAAVNAQKAAVPEIIAATNLKVSSQLIAAGLNPATFDPLKTPFVPNRTGYDQVLESVSITRSPTTGSDVTVGTSEFQKYVGTWDGTFNGQTCVVANTQLSYTVSSVVSSGSQANVVNVVESLRYFSNTTCSGSILSTETDNGTVTFNGTKVLEGSTGNTFTSVFTRGGNGRNVVVLTENGRRGIFGNLSGPLDANGYPNTLNRSAALVKR